MRPFVKGLIGVVTLALVIVVLFSGFIFNPGSPSIKPKEVQAAEITPDSTIASTVSSVVSVTSAPSPATTVSFYSPAADSSVETARPLRQHTVPTAPATVPAIQHYTLDSFPVSVYTPQDVPQEQTLQLLVVLHGMNGNGQAFSQGILSFAREHHLMVMAPTFNYNPDYRSPEIVAREDAKLTVALDQMVDELGPATHRTLKTQVLLYGFSRGCQLALHYAMIFPARVSGAVLFSGGAYTLPYATYGKTDKPLPFPVGVYDLKKYTGRAFDHENFVKIPFQIEVGMSDTDPNGVSRAWDSYLGNTRLQRAQNFYHILKEMGLNVTLETFPDTGHEVSRAMNQSAAEFLQKLLEV
ncbi:MAG TPA: alpha/beta hydrolase-fold protein [Chloroflexia bacterium]|nr:alpha/beta hydrolase-fold protein [Chloroflexia bacterium]